MAHPEDKNTYLYHWGSITGVPYLQTTLDHPPAHEPLGASHEEQQSQPCGEGAVEGASGCEVHGRHREYEAQDPAPHAVAILHPEDEFEVLRPER